MEGAVRAETVLIAAVSGRALAEAARRAGYTPLVADMFGDADTVAAAAAHRVIHSAAGPGAGFDGDALIAALGELAAAACHPPIGIVYGAGFEGDSLLLEKLAARWPVLGNSADVVAAVKNPFKLRDALASLCIPHPETVDPAAVGNAHGRASHASGGGWLLKQSGGAGGGHIRRLRSDGEPASGDELPPATGGVAQATAVPRNANALSAVDGLNSLHKVCGPDAVSGIAPWPSGCYLQREVPGRAVSALIAANGRNAEILGFSEQWPSPAPVEPFRFGGAVQPATIAPEQRELFAAAIQAVTADFGLRGLNSVDFITGEAGWWLIEINPRPGATLDILDDANIRLFHAHIGGAMGAPLSRARSDGTGTPARAMSIVYTPETQTVTVGCWKVLPEWLKDQPQPKTIIRSGAPVCTVLANADTVGEARRLCAQRGAQALEVLTQ